MTLSLVCDGQRREIAAMMANLGLHSWHDFVSTAARRATEPAAPGGGSDSTTSGSGYWDNNVGFDGALKMATQGWPEGATQIAKQLDSLPPRAEVLPDWSMDVAGVMCNVPAFIAGEPECMWHMSECKREERRLTLIVNGSYSASINADKLVKYAVAVTAITRSLEASGINVAVYSVSVSTIGLHNASADGGYYGVAIREFGEPLDLAKVAFAFHPAFLRRVAFAWREITPEVAATGIGSGYYGIPQNVSPKVLEAMFGLAPGMLITLPSPNDVLLKVSDPDPMKVLQEAVEKAVKEQSH